MEDDEYGFDWNDSLNRSTQKKHRTGNRQPSISMEQVEAEKKHEFIRLNDEGNSVKLVIAEGFTKQWERLHGLLTSSPDASETTNMLIPTVSNNDVLVISILGDTTDGKSFLLNHLLPTEEKDRPTVVDDTKREGSTTANITCFESASFLPESSKTNTLFLDYEGENGSYQPQLLQSTHDQWTPECAEKRRKAVSEYFPKLAFTISNVVILLSRDDFSKYDYISRCYDFAERATRRLQQNPYKPVLILVHNYCPHSLLQPIKEVTQQFFAVHLEGEAGKLKNFYKAVYGVRLPEKIPETSNMTQLNEIFHKQVIDLKNLLVHIQKKCKKEDTLPQIAWLDITKNVVDIVSNNGTIMMHMLIRQILVKDPGNTELNTVLFLFNMLYNKRDIHSSRWFHFCQNFAMSTLARAIAIRFVHNMKYIPKGSLKNMAIREEARVCLESLRTSLEELRPCTAIYMGEGSPKDKKSPVFCLQHRGVHQEHRTSQEVYGTSLFTTFSRKIPRVWGIHDVWSGAFESTDHYQGTSSEDIHNKFYTEISAYIQEIDSADDALYMTFNRLLYQYDISIDCRCQIPYGACCCCCCCFQTTQTNNAICSQCDEKRSILLRENSLRRVAPPQDNEHQCVICMAAPRITMLDPCLHQHFCQPCADRIQKEYGRCPLCRTNIEKLITPK